MQKVIDCIQQNHSWTFDREVSEVFSDMLSRSIPNYDTMRDLVYRVCRKFVKPDTWVLDLGCSTGLSSKNLIFGDVPSNIMFMLCDISEPMLEKCRFLYQGCNNVLVENFDITECDLPKGRNFSVVISCLTIQFIPIEYRQKVLERIYDSLNPGGAFVWVEKVIGNSAVIDDMMVSEYYDIKRENAYTEEQIASKRKALEGSLVPLTEKMNESLLVNAGFRRYDMFWRYLNFCGIVAVK